MSHCGYFVTTLILLTSGLLSIGFSVERKTCFNVSNRHICYFQPQENPLTNNRITWNTAWNTCQKNNATLPIIENQEVQKTFEEYLANTSRNANETWLGGRQLIKREWQWYNKKPFYQPDLIKDGYENPNTEAIIAKTSGSDSQSSARIEYHAWDPSLFCFHICQYPASRCPADDLTIQNEHHGCLKVSRGPSINMSEAAKNCSNGGGHLAIFDGDEFLTNAPEVYQKLVIHSIYFVCYYIGLHRIDTKWWLWMRSYNKSSTMDGNYNNWSNRNDSADRNCVFTRAKDHRWETSNCFARKSFICQTIGTLLTATTATAKEDPDKMNDQPLVKTRMDSTSRKSTTAPTAENSPTATVTLAATISSHSNVSSVTVGLVTGIGVAVPLFLIIIILIIINLKLKKKLRKMAIGKVDNKVQRYQELQKTDDYAEIAELQLPPE